MQKSDWKKCKLGDVAQFKTGKLNSNAAVSNGRYLFFTCAPQPLKIDSYAYDQQAILLAGNNADGNFAIHYYEGKFNAYQRTYIINTLDNNSHLKYLYYALSQCLSDFKLLSQGTSTKFLTAVILNNFEINLPPVEEQKRIADILGAFDDKIELLQKQNKTLEDMAKALFKSWFVDFDVVRAKQKGLPKANIMREYHLTDDLYDLFPSSFADSPLGPIPLGWQVGKLANIAHVLGGFAFKSKDFTTSGIPVIKIKNIQSDHSVDLEDVQYVDEHINKKTEKFILSDGDIVMAMTGATIGKFAILVNKKEMPSLLNQRVAKISAREDSCHWFVYLALLLNDIEEQVKNNGSGSAQPNISAEGIGNSRIIEPNSFLRKEYALYVKSYMDKILYNKKQIQTLTELRDTLLPRLISGKIRV